MENIRYEPFENYTLIEEITSYVQAYQAGAESSNQLTMREEFILSLLDIVKIDESVLNVTFETPLHKRLVEYFKLS